MKPNNKRCVVWIDQADEQYAPPSSTVVGLEAIGDVLHIVFAAENSDNAKVEYVTEQEVMVDLETFLRSLHATVRADVVALVHLATTPPLPKQPTASDT